MIINIQISKQKSIQKSFIPYSELFQNTNYTQIIITRDSIIDSSPTFMHGEEYNIRIVSYIQK